MGELGGCLGQRFTDIGRDEFNVAIEGIEYRNLLFAAPATERYQRSDFLGQMWGSFEIRCSEIGGWGALLMKFQPKLRLTG